MKKELCILLLMVVGILSACSDDDETEKTGSHVAKITISETMTNDGGTVNKKDTYSFTANKLVNHTTLQEYYSPYQSQSESQSVSYETNFIYSKHQAVISDANGNVATYTLGDDGYAQKCSYRMGEQIREYDFFYVDNQLTQMDEKIDGELFSTIKLEYNAGDLQKISTTGYSILCQVGNDMNQYDLPCTIFADAHPLSMHLDAIWAKLLGKQSSHLVTRTAPEGNAEEWTEYVYQLDKNNKPTNLKVSTTSTGTVYDSAGNASEVTRTDTRKLNFVIE